MPLYWITPEGLGIRHARERNILCCDRVKKPDKMVDGSAWLRRQYIAVECLAANSAQ